MRQSIGAILAAGLFATSWLPAQTVDPALARDVDAIRAQLRKNAIALKQYTWTEHTEVLVDKKVKSSTDMICRYNETGDLIKTPVGPVEKKETQNSASKRYMNRKKGDMQDYIDRSLSMIHNYIPPKPDQLDFLLRKGMASHRPDGNNVKLLFREYFQDNDSMVFTYDAASKLLQEVAVSSTLGTPKDPVTMNIVFETLPDGLHHLASTSLEAKSKKIEVKMKNSAYQKTAR